MTWKELEEAEIVCPHCGRSNFRQNQNETRQCSNCQKSLDEPPTPPANLFLGKAKGATTEESANRLMILIMKAILNKVDQPQIRERKEK